MGNPTAAEQDRIRRAAFNITAAFEGGKGYANYQTYDAGVISYGRFQFTLAAGSMGRVVDNYLASATSDVANQLRAYQARIQARDATLRNDETLKGLMVAAANEDAMKVAQDSVVITSYWAPSQDSVTARGIVTPLGQAMLFDMAIQHGPAHKYTQTAEQMLGASPRSHLGENGLNEQQLITKTAEVRRDFLYDFAARENLPGVKKRADFWIDLIGANYWQLQGDANGNVLVYSVPVQVKNPPGPALVSGSAPVSASPQTPPPPAPPVATPQPQPAPVAPPPVSPPPAASSDPGQPLNGIYTTNRVLTVRATPDVNGELLGRVMTGKALTVTRQHIPSANEEWLLTEVGWVARRLLANPGEVFGDLK